MMPVRAELRSGRQVFVGSPNGDARELAQLLRDDELVPAMDPAAPSGRRELRVRASDLAELAVFGPDYAARFVCRPWPSSGKFGADHLDELAEAVETIERELGGRGPRVEGPL
jgi:hypothetical protein